MNVTCPANLSRGLITLMLYGREYGLRSSCLCIYLHSLYMYFSLYSSRDDYVWHYITSTVRYGVIRSCLR